MTVAVLQFPGSNCDIDCLEAFRRGVHAPAELVWHKETSLEGYDAICVPGGFSYGDYLRAGAIARFSPVMSAVLAAAERGLPVIGICNGFQILCEAGLLPGALIRNGGLQYRCETVTLAVQDAGDSFNAERLGRNRLHLPIGHGEGNYRIDQTGLRRLRDNGQILMLYADSRGGAGTGSNPNGSVANIAGVRNETGNVWGMMPHPDRAWEPFHPSRDGLAVLEAFLALKPLAAH